MTNPAWWAAPLKGHRTQLCSCRLQAAKWHTLGLQHAFPPVAERPPPTLSPHYWFSCCLVLRQALVAGHLRGDEGGVGHCVGRALGLRLSRILHLLKHAPGILPPADAGTG